MQTSRKPHLEHLLQTAPKTLGVLAAIALAFGVAGCMTLSEVKLDPTLEATRVKLMEGAITRDQSVIQPRLAPDFAWREDDAPLDEEPYDFWNRHKLWPRLSVLLQEKLVLQNGLLKAPRASLSENYKGPRLAWRKVGEDWRLAYFLAGVPVAP